MESAQFYSPWISTTTPVSGRSHKFATATPSASTHTASMSTDTALGQVLQAITDLKAEVQQNRNFISTVLEEVKEMKDGYVQLKLKEEVGRLNASYQQLMSSPTNTTEKLPVPASLKKSIRSLHKSYKEDNQFDFTEKYDGGHNSAVLVSMQEALLALGKNEEAIIQQGIRGFFKFESSQRMLRGYSAEEKRGKRLRQRKERLLRRREKYLDANERQNWTKSRIGWQFMSDEETDPEDPSRFVVHSPMWRSYMISSFLYELDKREANDTTKTSHQPAKPRKRGDSKFCFPPKGTERFLISKEFKIGYCGIPPSTTEQLLPMPTDIAVSGYSSGLDDDYDPDDMQAGSTSEPDDEFESDISSINSTLSSEGECGVDSNNDSQSSTEY